MKEYVKVNLHGHICTVECESVEQVATVKREAAEMGCDAEHVAEPEGEHVGYWEFNPA